MTNTETESDLRNGEHDQNLRHELEDRLYEEHSQLASELAFTPAGHVIPPATNPAPLQVRIEVSMTGNSGKLRTHSVVMHHQN